MTSSDTRELLLATIRKAAVANGNADTWRMIALRLIVHSTAQAKRIDQLERTNRRHLEELKLVWADRQSTAA